jgi:hypothetical protein
MKLTSQEIADLLHMSKYGFHKLAQNLNIPHRKKGNRFIYDTESPQCRDFFESVEQAYHNPLLQPIYSVRDLAEKRGQHKDTIRTFLIEHDIKIYYSGRKWLVMLVDLQRFQQLTHEDDN